MTDLLLCSAVVRHGWMDDWMKRRDMLTAGDAESNVSARRKTFPRRYLLCCTRLAESLAFVTHSHFCSPPEAMRVEVEVLQHHVNQRFCHGGGWRSVPPRPSTSPQEVHFFSQSIKLVTCVYFSPQPTPLNSTLLLSFSLCRCCWRS